MSSRASLPPTVSSAVRVWVLLVALAGLFAMHGLSDHGMAGPSDVAGVVTAHAAHESMVVPAAGEAEPEPEPPGGHDMGMGGVCLAVLIAALLLGVALWHRTRAAVASRPPRGLAGLIFSARMHVPRPPDLFALSIQRC